MPTDTGSRPRDGAAQLPASCARPLLQKDHVGAVQSMPEPREDVRRGSPGCTAGRHPGQTHGSPAGPAGKRAGKRASRPPVTVQTANAAFAACQLQAQDGPVPCRTDCRHTGVPPGHAVCRGAVRADIAAHESRRVGPWQRAGLAGELMYDSHHLSRRAVTRRAPMARALGSRASPSSPTVVYPGCSEM